MSSREVEVGRVGFEEGSMRGGLMFGENVELRLEVGVGVDGGGVRE